MQGHRPTAISVSSEAHLFVMVFLHRVFSILRRMLYDKEKRQETILVLAPGRQQLQGSSTFPYIYALLAWFCSSETSTVLFVVRVGLPKRGGGRTTQPRLETALQLPSYLRKSPKNVHVENLVCDFAIPRIRARVLKLP